MASSICTTILLLLFFIFNIYNIYTANAQAIEPCDPVFAAMSPCLPYITKLRGSGGSPSEICCRGAQGVAMIESNPMGKAFVCVCLKNFMDRFRVVDAQHAQNATSQCNVTLRFVTSVTDCLTEIRG